MTDTDDIVLEARGISKSFPGVKALDRVSLALRRGRLTALLGENGAGKSTLMNILAGVIPPDSGALRLDGHPVGFTHTREARAAGIVMIFQELNLIPELTVAENMFLGREPLNRLGLVDGAAMNRQAAVWLRHLDFGLPPATPVGCLRVGQQQIVEIAKALAVEARVILMDEPTSAITEKEVAHLFRMINSLRDNGVAIIYITHKMDEVFQISDEVTVLRDGKYVGTKPAPEITKHELISMMVGRELTNFFPKEDAEITDVKLEVKNISLEGKFHDVSFTVRKGEILGIAGLMGSGRTEVIESIFGVYPPDSGEIFVDGKPVSISQPMDAIRAGMGLLTEDRKLSGLFLPLSVRDNMVASNIDKYVKRTGLDFRLMTEDCEHQRQALAVRTPSLDQLSRGGCSLNRIFLSWMNRLAA